MSLYVYCTPTELKECLRTHQEKFKLGTEKSDHLWEDSGADGVGADNKLTSALHAWDSNVAIGAWLVDDSALIFPVTSNTATELLVGTSLSDRTTIKPADGDFTVTKLGQYIGGAQGIVDAALARVYSLPLLGTGQGVRDLLREIVIGFALFNLHADSYLESSPAGNIAEFVDRKHKAAQDILASILKGEYLLIGEHRIAGNLSPFPKYQVADRMFTELPGTDGRVIDDAVDVSEGGQS